MDPRSVSYKDNNFWSIAFLDGMIMMVMMMALPTALTPPPGFQVLMELSRHVHDANPIKASVMNAFSEFRRTHVDNWAEG
jgi:hypothetical protein